jgi:hypothetical protein
MLSDSFDGKRKVFVAMPPAKAIDALQDIWTDGRDMRDYPATLLQRYLDGETEIDICVSHVPPQWVRIDMLYYIERAAVFVLKHYGRKHAGPE